MSREVRRVPMGYEHPHEYNKNWMNHTRWEIEQHGRHIDKGIPEDHCFIGLFDGNRYAEHVESHKEEIEKIRNKEGHAWNWAYNYHFVGYDSSYYGKWMEPNPKFLFHERYPEDAVIVLDEKHLVSLLIEKELRNPVDPLNYTAIPEVDADTDGFGYCLYETVSEGTPVTPVFASKEDLVDHLVNVGNFWGEKYDRRNAEALVDTGYSLGSFAVVDGQMYNSSSQAADLNDALDK